MNNIRAQLIANGNLIADVRTESRVGKTAAKRAKRFKAAAESRAMGTSTAVKFKSKS